MPKRPKSARPNKLSWQLKVELLDVTPRVWRRILVPETIVLPKLDRVIQAAVGWTNSHLHEFVLHGVRYGTPDGDFSDEPATVDEKGVELRKALGMDGRCFNYVYDFGDDWHHVVIIENLFAHASSGPQPARCIAGENACPPEDVGGSHGYVDFLAALADPEHAERENYLRWIGGSFDPTQFDLARVNRALGKIKL